ncbi:helix-turn-helix domain-containing protein [Actinokineospora sp.]|uniref:helix-turn-helix domain-containing protein n=1 Tax=Actinokineospora sp. TaxID=1872133 RepID=UPI003D6C5308
MSRFRLQPTPAQERVLLEHCGHARFVWNLAVEQHAHWKPGRRAAPGFAEQCRQLTRARSANPWLAGCPRWAGCDSAGRVRSPTV